MSPYFIILSSALSLGGMASVGISHFQDTRERVAEVKTAAAKQTGDAVLVAELSQKVDQGLSRLEENLSGKQKGEMEAMAELVAKVKRQLATVESRQSSHEVMLSKLDREYASLEFKVETHDESFRPLRAMDSRLERVEDVRSQNEDVHPLLPALGESSWREDY
jgi:predicted transcriptional regulator